MIYGSGLRTGDANIGPVLPYAQFNIGLSHEFLLCQRPKAAHGALRRRQHFRQRSTQIRDGTGIGVFAPQFRPARDFFLGPSKKL